MELRKFVIPEVVYGKGALSLIGRYAKNFGTEKALIVTDPTLVELGWVKKVTASLHKEKIKSVIFQDVTVNPKDHEVAAGVEFYRENSCDVIIAVGGGSPMDCAKGIGISHANNSVISSFEGVDEVPMPGPPLICIPSTAGSSADVSQFAIITDTARKVKFAIITKMAIPDVSLIDPEITVTMPEELTSTTGIDALVHAIEAYVSNASSVITDTNAIAAIPLIVNNLIPAINNPTNLEHRNKMMQGSLFAGLAFSNASLGLVHAMAHSLGGLLDLPHGTCNALLLSLVIEFNYDSVPDRYDKIAATMGADLVGMTYNQRREALVNKINTLCSDAGINSGIGRLGVTREQIKHLAINALNDPSVITNPRNVSIQDIERIYEKTL